MKPRLLHLTTTAISLDWLLGPQLTAFQEAGFEVITASAPGDHVDAVKARGLTHIPVPSLSRNMDVASDARAWRELCTLFGDIKPHIVHTHNPKPGVLGRFAARRAGVPIVVNTVHGLYAQPTDSFKRRVPVFGIERLAAVASHAELVQNIEDVEQLAALGVPADRLHLLGNGIDLPAFSPTLKRMRAGTALRKGLGIAPLVPVIGVVGRLVWEKGYREFFDAVQLLRSSVEGPFEVVVVGPMEPGKAGAVDQASIDEMQSLGVKFLGSRTDIDVLLAMFDIFVLASHREGFPRSAMEASAMATPVVTTNIRGCRQVVADGQTGVLVPVRDSKALAAGIEGLLGDPARRSEMGKAAQKRAHAEFDQQRVIARTLSVYRAQLRRVGIAQPAPVETSLYMDSIDLVETEASKPAELRSAA